MKALFNCSFIKNVYLRLDSSLIELEITFTDDQNRAWVCNTLIDDMRDRQGHNERYGKAYNTIKQALLNKEPFVEIEL